MDAAERYHELTRIFIATCNLGPAERQKELDRLCGKQDDLRVEVELLLTFHDQISEGGRESRGGSRRSRS